MAAIRPLPEAVASKIESSVNITSLSQVVTGLLENSIDANASNISISVDFARGSCSAEDDGVGILPADFHESGGLGRLYHTSKSFGNIERPHRHGVFLASVAALSVVTLISHHASSRSTNAVTFHYSRTAARLIPAPTHMIIRNRSHGTKVVVHDLFGNFAVRVKTRPTGENGSKARDKLWRLLCKSVIGILLARAIPVNLVLRSKDDDQYIKFRNRLPRAQSSNEPTLSPIGNSSFDIETLKDVLLQSGFIDSADWKHWVTTSAKTSSITVRALFSTEPAPSKDFQFVSIGSRSIDSDHSYNILYDQINNQFSRSSFGIREEGSQSGNTNTPNQSPSRYRQPILKQLRGTTKGVDRWPMFYVRIDIDSRDDLGYHTNATDGGTQLLAILNVLQAMIESFLEQNNFRPYKRRNNARVDGPKDLSKSQNLAAKPVHLDNGRQQVLPSPLVNRSRQTPEEANSIEYLRNNLRSPNLESDSGMWQESEYFSGFGRIIYGLPHIRFPRTGETNELVSQQPERSNQQPAPQGGSKLSGATDGAKTNLVTADSDRDETVRWINPVNKVNVLINKRTGFVVTPNNLKRPTSAPMIDSNIDKEKFGECRQLLRRCKSSDTNRAIYGDWASSLLSDWKNPVFERADEPILQARPQELALDNHFSLPASAHVGSRDLFQFSNERTRLRKSDLQSCRIISQVDSKFILAKIDRKAESGNLGETHSNNLLILVDQHAADERIRVEALFAELCPAPNGNEPGQAARGTVTSVTLPTPIHFDLRPNEQTVFLKQQAYFEYWGIFYKVRKTASIQLSGTSRPRWSLEAVSLPPAIAERCRIDPKLLVDLLRSEAWSREQMTPWNSRSREAIPEDTKESPYWLKIIHDCPRGMLEMINSRACRSSIMFNDRLSLQECEILVRKLAKCQFPFQCAHGRPSMIPLLNLGGLESIETRSSNSGYQEPRARSDFVSKWEAWESS